MQVLQGSQHHCLALKGVNSNSNDLNIFSVFFLSISLVGFLLTLLTSFEFQFFLNVLFIIISHLVLPSVIKRNHIDCLDLAFVCLC